MDKIKVAIPIIVEGRYDKSTLMGFIDATVITTEGFGIFKNRAKQEYLRKICENGVIVLTDSDGGGKQIRAFLQGILPSGKIYNLYIPKINGKERRKVRPSKSGTLGVEGMSRELLLDLLSPFVSDAPKKEGRLITKAELYADGLTGKPDSSAMRAELCRFLDLPEDLSTGALLDTLNLLYGYEEYKGFIQKIKKDC